MKPSHGSIAYRGRNIIQKIAISGFSEPLVVERGKKIPNWRSHVKQQIKSRAVELRRLAREGTLVWEGDRDVLNDGDPFWRQQMADWDDSFECSTHNILSFVRETQGISALGANIDQ
jgi:hypothetical protein